MFCMFYACICAFCDNKYAMSEYMYTYICYIMHKI